MPPFHVRRLPAQARLGPYEILDLIGAGGMGEVYRARDSRLDRTVAVKVLGASVLDSPLARARFEREARVISSLSHPHICAVYDVGREGDVAYIVMEYLQGEPLSQRLDRRALRFDQALELAVQIASALAAAHRAGIVHRDLKPGNVMVTAQGAKLLDFGLAKQEAPPAVRPDVTPDTVTVEGPLVGTLPYMSPEQVEGQPADARSDIFAFGAMLHEMLTRQRAFEGSPAHLIASILSSDPPPPSTLQPLCPPELDHLVARCLAKDPNERWQSAQDVLLELKWAAARMPPVESPRKRSLRTLGWAVGAAAVTAALVVLAVRHEAEDPLPAATPRRITIAPGLESAPALSPDGGLIAYASDESGNQDIWIVDGRGGNAIRLTDDPAADTDPAWLPDGSALLFTSDRGGQRAMWKVLRFGGAPTLVVANAEDPAVSPDESQIAFARAGPDGKARIWVAPVADPTRARMLTGDDDGLWDHRDPAFSPDGRTICYRALRDLWVVPVEGRPALRLTTDDQGDAEPAWSPDGRHVYFSSFRGGAWALWRIPSAGGVPRRLTLGTGGERHPSISRDGKRLALATVSDRREIVLLDLASRKEVRLPSTNPAGLDWAPDGRGLVFAAARIGERVDLWLQPMVDLEAAGPPRRLTDQAGAASSPAFSPDGRWIAYYRILEGQRDIWIVPAAGGGPLQFTNDKATDVHPTWSPDGSSIAFSSDRGGSSRIWVAPVASGRPAAEGRAVTTGPTTDQWPAWSPDGKWIAYCGTASDGAVDVWVTDASGAAPARMMATEGRAGQARWEPGSRTLLVSGLWESGVGVRRYSAVTGARITLDPPLGLGQNPDLYGFSVTSSGRTVAYRKSDVRGDVWAFESQDHPY